MQPTNTKSLFHSMCALIEKLENGTVDKASADLMIKAAKTAHDFINIELKRVKTLYDIGMTENKLREIEITNPEA